MNATPNEQPAVYTREAAMQRYCDKHEQPRPLTLRQLLAELGEENPDRFVIVKVEGCDGYAHATELTTGDLGEPCIEITCHRQFPG